MGSVSRRRKACPSDTVCVPCTQAAMVLPSVTVFRPTAVLKPALRSPEKADMNSSSLIGLESEDTTSLWTCFTGMAFLSSVFLTGEGVSTA